MCVLVDNLFSPTNQHAQQDHSCCCSCHLVLPAIYYSNLGKNTPKNVYINLRIRFMEGMHSKVRPRSYLLLEVTYHATLPTFASVVTVDASHHGIFTGAILL